MISKSAVISGQSKIGSHVSIGHYSIIEDDVVIGDHTIIGHHVSILNGARIGKNCHIHACAVLSGVPQDLKFRGEYTTLEIGDRNIIRESVTINRGTNTKKATRIGNDNLIMANAHIGHDCEIGNHCIVGYSVGMAGEVIVHDYANISGLTGIHQFSTIGESCMVGGLSKIVKDIPPYIIAAREPLTFEGINRVGLKRRGFDESKLYELKEIYKVIFGQKQNTSNAIDRIEANFEPTPERDRILHFIRQSRRGIIKGYFG